MRCPEEEITSRKRTDGLLGCVWEEGVLGLIPGGHKEIQDDGNILTWVVVGLHDCK